MAVPLNNASQFSIEALNAEYVGLEPVARLNRLSEQFQRILVTSSFGASSAILLHLLSQSALAKVPVYIVNTGFLFPETLAYRQNLAELLNLTVAEIVPEPWRFKVVEDTRMWETHPDLCCTLKKVEPMDDFTKNYDVWISGIMGWQSHHRGKQEVFSRKKEILKFHPLLELTQAQAEAYMLAHNLPEHPLKEKGFASIGCMPCTQRGVGREGRWGHLPGKTECGLHL
jgi:phosphoadenosine phosphosulfate reductase